MPLHPHTKRKIDEYQIKTKISLIGPIGYVEMLSFLNRCELVITDSGGLQKESYFAKKKCIVVREETEWIELIDEGVNTLCKPKDLLKAYHSSKNGNCSFNKNFYGSGNSSQVILNSIKNYFK